MTQRGIARKTSNGYEVTFERRVLHSPGWVWEMLTEEGKIGMWFCAWVEIEGWVGGKIVEHHDHVGVDVYGEVTRWEPPRVFEHSWWFGDSQAAPMGMVRWELLAEEPGTRLILTHRRGGLDASAMAGAHTSLDVLCAVLDGADPNTHAAPEGEFRNGKYVETRPGRGLWANRDALEREYERDFAGRETS